MTQRAAVEDLDDAEAAAPSRTVVAVLLALTGLAVLAVGAVWYLSPFAGALGGCGGG